MIKMIDITGKWALVTGASRGIGREIAIALSELGCNLLLHSRSVAHTSALASEVSIKGVRAISLAADLSNPVEVSQLLSDIDNTSIQVDILYNNAAIMAPYHEDIWEIPADDFRTSFETNVISQIAICNALIPPMIARGWGRVVNLSSAIQDLPQLAPYAISKAALRKFVKDFVPILKDTGVAMNLLDPGWLKTDMGSAEAPNSVESVIPGALIPVLLARSSSGLEFKAQHFVGMSIEQALVKAEQCT